MGGGDWVVGHLQTLFPCIDFPLGTLILFLSDNAHVLFSTYVNFKHSSHSFVRLIQRERLERLLVALALL